MRRRATAISAACLALLGGPAGGALAAQTEGYNPVPGAPAGVVPTAQTAVPVRVEASPLPFTGADLIVVVGASVVLVSLGLALRRTSRAR